MSDQVWLATIFETYRKQLFTVAYRMLGSISEAEDAVQETWLRLSRIDVSTIQNIGGWLTTVVSRICLDMLRSRKSRKEETLEAQLSDTLTDHQQVDPEQEALIADSVGAAMLVVLAQLKPAERIAFVLHDVFHLPFQEIAPIIGKSEDATRQIASRARRRVRGEKAPLATNADDQHEAVKAFLAAAHAGDFNRLIAALDPEVVLRDDRESEAAITRGAVALAKKVAGRAQKSAQLALVDGTVGIIAAPRGKLLYVLKFNVTSGKITEIDLISHPERLAKTELAVLAAD